ncbi:MAG: hypothetical protein COB02_01810 [Candidatus Cloacimonadota bacterium]|nr:MAG: hypothetical protein COB02_01810 [Candidatus Cloacimonadota bacterium]
MNVKNKSIEIRNNVFFIKAPLNVIRFFLCNVSYTEIGIDNFFLNKSNYILMTLLFGGIRTLLYGIYTVLRIMKIMLTYWLMMKLYIVFRFKILNMIS